MNIKSLLLAVLVAFSALAFNSCSSDKEANASDLLATVPSDVSLVAVINSQQLLEKAGCKIDGTTVSPGKGLNDFLAGIKDQKIKSFFTVLTGSQSGIDPSVLVVFTEGYNSFVTGVAADPEMFKKTFSSLTESPFTTSKGIEVSGNCALADNQFWINLTGSTIDESDVRHFNSLSKSQSFLQNPYANKMTSVVQDIEGWGNINGLLNSAEMNFQTRATWQVAIQTLFEDPNAFTFSVDWNKQQVKSDVFVLNSKGNNAKYLLPSDKVDVNTIASLGGTCESLAALAIPGKLIETLKKDAGSKAPSVLGVYLQQLGCVNGTTALAMSGDDVRGVITTNGSSASGLIDMLSSFGLSATINGNLVNVSKGNVTGPGNVAEMARNFNGTVGGVTGISSSESSMPFGLSTYSLMLYAQGNSLKITLIIK